MKNLYFYLVTFLVFGLPKQILAHSDESDLNHHDMMGFDWGIGWGFGYMWLFWLFVIIGLFWLTQKALSQRPEATQYKVYICSECGYEYADKKWAQKCQAWCQKHKSCNLEIIKHRVNK